MGRMMESTISNQTDDVVPALLVGRRRQIVDDDLLPAMESLFRSCFPEAGDQTTGFPVGDPIDVALQGEGPANFFSVCIRRFVEVKQVYWDRLAEVEAETEVAALPPHLARIKRGMADLTRKARHYRNTHGSPADNLSKLLGGDLTVEEWQDILNEPYG